MNDSRSDQKFVNEIYSKPPKNKHPTNKTVVYYIDDLWNLDILDLKDYGEEKIRGYRDALVIINNFSNFGWTTPLKNINAQTITESFEKNLINSKRKPNSIESDRGK